MPHCTWPCCVWCVGVPVPVGGRLPFNAQPSDRVHDKGGRVALDVCCIACIWCVAGRSHGGPVVGVLGRAGGFRMHVWCSMVPCVMMSVVDDGAHVCGGCLARWPAPAVSVYPHVHVHHACTHTARVDERDPCTDGLPDRACAVQCGAAWGPRYQGVPSTV